MQTSMKLKLRAFGCFCVTVTWALGSVAQAGPGPAPGAASEPPATPASEPPATAPGAAAAAPSASAAPSAAAAPAPAPQSGYVAPAYGYGATPSGYAFGAPVARAPELRLRDPRVANAHADRVVLLPTAYTHPEGTLYLTSNELVILQAGYAITDSTQLTLTGLPPLSEGPDKVLLFDLSLKNAFLRQGPLRLAGIGSVSGVFGIDQGNLVLGRVGAVAELCFEADCESSASLSSHVLLAGPGTFMVNGVGVIWRIADWAALLLEVDTAVPLGGEVGEYSGVLVAPGFRFPYRTWSLDLAAMRPLDTEDPPELALYPWISFTYRFLP